MTAFPFVIDFQKSDLVTLCVIFFGLFGLWYIEPL